MTVRGAQDQVAFAAAATTGFSRELRPVSRSSLVLEACSHAIRDAGLSARDVDGICGSMPAADYVQAALGIPEVTWFCNLPPPAVNHIAAAMGAVHAGLCHTVLVYHSAFRGTHSSRSAATDPYRRIAARPIGAPTVKEALPGTPAYAAWAARYLYESEVKREHFGYVALNGRANAAANAGAVMRQPMTMADYLAAPIIQAPLSILDMDLPADGADAFVITTTERARDMPFRPVLIHAASLGAYDKNSEMQIRGLNSQSQQVAVSALRERSDFWIDAIDLYFPYDGFTIITLAWMEAVGWCDRGQAGPFLESSWDAVKGRLLLDGRVPVNTHGGSLSEGASQGSGHIREAVQQLQGSAGSRQVAGASTALLTIGGLFRNAQGLALRTE